jgi:2-C-methyl-D-erythritol 4-phosphate cytidylyltransferase
MVGRDGFQRGVGVKQFAVVIPAAGQSTRFGGPVRKPFVTLAGKPVWHRTLDLFARRPDVAGVALVLSPDALDDFREQFGVTLNFTYGNVSLIAGGAERFESVANALAALPDAAEFVAVHDAVRCLTPTAVIDAVFAAAIEIGGAMAAVPLADTLKRVDPATNHIVETVPRAGLWQAQTPQAFRRDWLHAAYARRGELPGQITDDAQLMEAAGHPVVVVPGSPVNFKITTAADLALADAVLRPVAPPPPPVRRFGDDGLFR